MNQNSCKKPSPGLFKAAAKALRSNKQGSEVEQRPSERGACCSSGSAAQWHKRCPIQQQEPAAVGQDSNWQNASLYNGQKLIQSLQSVEGHSHRNIYNFKTLKMDNHCFINVKF